jgi:hypothetical protein
MIRSIAFLVGSTWLAASGTAAQDQAFKSSVVSLGEKAPGKWMLVKAQVDAKILVDRDYKFSVVPKEINGAALVVRTSDDHAYWLAASSVIAKKDGTAFAIIRTKYNGKEVVTAAVLKKLEGDGWTAVEGEVGTTSPGSENWGWVAYKKDFKAGEIDLSLKSMKWASKSAVLFAFK